MTDMPDRYHRNILLFGADGQQKLRSTAVVVAGTGGLGSPLIQHLALLGVKRITSIDDEELDDTNRNRFVGARHTDPIPGSAKVIIANRLIRETNPDVESVPLECSLVSERAFAAIREANWVLGCFDHDGPRAILNELCAAYERPYIDLASDVPEPGIYGGRVCVSVGGQGCLDCLGLLDRKMVRRYIETDESRNREDAIYGIAAGALDVKGPSVSPLNGVIAGLAALEFMVAVTGLRAPKRLQTYRGWESKVVVSLDEPRTDCLVCKGIRGRPEEADVERYLKLSHLLKRRN
ncbi:MAG: ThiF family adenylyltransferase [Reyranella sp.]|uniref:HesA/MoeB/ThiF family protein n=1 Tax=Reyranella sp. TaxID=1929291 RepID=UPI0012145B44|nr:ThiF family adenylyltransferase [Reyranella sp.]TAJ39007.1 MAG: ThiF family adenylyltransferase [Reyranella sp.]